VVEGGQVKEGRDAAALDEVPHHVAERAEDYRSSQPEPAEYPRLKRRAYAAGDEKARDEGLRLDVVQVVVLHVDIVVVGVVRAGRDRGDGSDAEPRPVRQQVQHG